MFWSRSKVNIFCIFTVSFKAEEVSKNTRQFFIYLELISCYRTSSDVTSKKSFLTLDYS